MLYRLFFLCFLFSCSTTKVTYDRGPRGTSTTSKSTAQKALVKEAKNLIGSPYKYAGTTPRGFDCSGFTSYVYKNAINKVIERTARAQGTMGLPIALKDTEAGDLIFYRLSPNSQINHVSLIVENKGSKLYVIHATSSKGVIREDIYSSSYWMPKVAFARRIL